jgi:hypothetical protein
LQETSAQKDYSKNRSRFAIVGRRAYIWAMPKFIELPPAVARRFVEDMGAFQASTANPIMAFMNAPRLKNLGKTCDSYAPSIPDKHFGRSLDVRKILRALHPPLCVSLSSGTIFGF